MVIAQFEKLVFGLSANTALLLNNIKLSAECETDSQSDNSQQYVTAKNGKPLQVTFTAIIDANLGSDVKESVVYALDGAQRGLQGYFYIAGEKVFPFKVMLVKADTEEIKLSPAGEWVKTNVSITLKQSTKEWFGINPSAPSQSAPQYTGGGGSPATPAKASVTSGAWLSGATAAAVSGTWLAAKKPTSTGTSLAAQVAGASKNATKEKGTVSAAVKGAVSAAAAVIRGAKTVASTVAKRTPKPTIRARVSSAKVTSAARRK